MSEKQVTWLDQIEPGTSMLACHIEVRAQISTAISLKRIADTLEVLHKRRELTNLTDAINRVTECYQELLKK